jgi:hypothetical protein
MRFENMHSDRNSAPLNSSNEADHLSDGVVDVHALTDMDPCAQKRTPGPVAAMPRLSSDHFQPRIVRFRDAPRYLGMDRNRFNAEVRPHLTEIPIGSQGIGFDRLDLDAWADDYKSRNGRPGRWKGDKSWDAKKCQASSGGATSGISIRSSAGGEFVRALAQLGSKTQKRCSSRSWKRRG